jgi:tetratricopeptide (TPR) repeat protein
MQYFNLVPFQTSLQFNALSLTLGNPNFASALMGVMISGHITYIYIDKSKRNYISWAILSSAMFQLYLIKSLQGFLVVLFSLLIILVRHKRDLISSISLTKKILISILILTLLYFILFKTTLAQWIYINGSVRNRLSYWELSFNIFRDNFLLGVGIDNLRNYALAYRDLSLTLQEGVFTIPDRSHNVAIDHFVNGGIVAGILWLVFIVSVSYLAIRLINYDPEIEKTYLIIVIIWFGYLIQSLISVDHLSLTSLAFITSGLMIHKWLTLKKLEKGLSKRFFTYTFLARVLSLTLGISSIFLILMFMPNEIRAGKLYYEGKLQVVNELLGNMRIQSQTLEKIMVDMSQKKRFDLANSFAEKLLIASPNSHQAYYVKSVYSESIGDDDLGKEFMLKAHKIDQWNPVYLLSLSIYEYKLGNISKAIEYFLRTEKINPNQQGLETVRKLLF